MPGFNGLGPINAGSMTGKGRGYCVRELDSKDSSYLGGFGVGRGMGRGRGIVSRREMGSNYQGLSRDSDQKRAQLKERQSLLKQELNMIEQQLADESNGE